MRIQRDALIAGFPANRIGELLRQSDDFLSCRHATKILGLDENKARYLLDRLARGLCRKKHRCDCLRNRALLETNAQRKCAEQGALLKARFTTDSGDRK